MALTSQGQHVPQKGKLFSIKTVFRSFGTSLVLAFAAFLASFFLSTTAAAQNAPLFKVVTNFAACGGFNTHVFIDVDTGVNGETGDNADADPRNRLAAAGFSINYNPAVLTNPVVTLGADAQNAGFILTTNPLNASTANGEIGILIDSGGFVPYSPPDRRMVVIRFDVVPGTPPGTTPITFDASPTQMSASNPGGDLYSPFAFQNGVLTVGGTACTTSSEVSIGGRVMTPDGNGLRGAQVVLTDSNGNRRSVTTSSLGYYQVDDVKPGETYVIGVSSRRYRFNSRTLQVTDSLTNVDFVGLE